MIGNLVDVARDALLALKTRSQRPFQNGKAMFFTIRLLFSTIFVCRNYVFIKTYACRCQKMTKPKSLTYLLVHDSSRQRVVIIPFSQNRAFVGREDVLDKIDAIFHDAKVDCRVAIYGLGGVG